MGVRKVASAFTADGNYLQAHRLRLRIENLERLLIFSPNLINSFQSQNISSITNRTKRKAGGDGLCYPGPREIPEGRFDELKMFSKNGAALVGKMYVEPHGQARCSILNACVGRHPPSDLGTGRPRGGGLLLPGQAVVGGTDTGTVEG